MAKKLNHQTILEAYGKIKDIIDRTPVFTSRSINSMVGCKVFFKGECFQKSGSFKARGVLNKVLKLKEDEPLRAVVTESGANHGLALAWACKRTQTSCTVVLPAGITRAKRMALHGYGAQVYGSSNSEFGTSSGRRIAEETGAAFIHPYNDFEIMAGHGTVALEFFEQVPQLDALIVPVGGGGLIAGCSTYVNHIKPGCKIFAAEPSPKQLERWLRLGNLVVNGQKRPLKTISDELRTPVVGDLCFPAMLKFCEKDVCTLPEADIVYAMRLTYERLKLVVEPSAAVAVAALFCRTLRRNLPKLTNVGVILTGGNLDLDALPWMKNKRY